MMDGGRNIMLEDGRDSMLLVDGMIKDESLHEG